MLIIQISNKWKIQLHLGFEDEQKTNDTFIFGWTIPSRAKWYKQNMFFLVYTISVFF